MTTPDDLPNLGLLIKLLKMTSSSHDGEALSAMRKANQQLVKFGGDWESLLRGKVTVIGDPFAGLDAAPAPQRTPPPPPPTMRRPPPPPPFSHRPAAPPPQQPRPWSASAPRSNLYSGPCVSCFKSVGVGYGWVVNVANGKWDLKCQSCHSGFAPAHSPYKKARRKPNPKTIHDLLDI